MIVGEADLLMVLTVCPDFQVYVLVGRERVYTLADISSQADLHIHIYQESNIYV